MAPPSPFRSSVTGRVTIVAHRGASAIAPENTMAAFRLAQSAGADLIELDVHLTADDEVVVIHDETLERTTDGRGFVRERTLAQVRALAITGGAGERVPTLDEVVGWVRTTRLGLALEVKQPTAALGRPRYAGIAERVAEILRTHRMLDRTIVHSFDHATVRRMRDLLPDVATAVLSGGAASADPVAAARAADASGIHPRWSSVTEALCEAAHAALLHVHAWGFPEPADRALLARLLAAGVDSLGANDPAALRSLLALTPEKAPAPSATRER